MKLKVEFGTLLLINFAESSHYFKQLSVPNAALVEDSAKQKKM